MQTCCECGRLNVEGDKTGTLEEDGEQKWICGTCWLKANLEGDE